MIARLSTWLGRPVDAGSLAIFRISVGLVMVIEVLRLVWPRSTGSDLHRWFSLEEVPVKIAYPGFEWWTGLPEPWLGLWVLVLGLASTALFLGVAARLAAGLAFLTWSGIWLLDAALYNNHFYVMSLMLLQLALMHSGRAFGLRASPGATVPFWNVALLRFQLVVIYFYAGVAKLTPEWLWYAEPVYTHLLIPATAERIASWPLLGSISPEVLAYFFCWAGMILDLGIGAVLLWRPTRVFALIVLLSFHFTNHVLLFKDIGVFPLLGALTAFIFLDPDWPQRRSRARAPATGDAGAAPIRTWALALGLAWCVLHLALPLRHYVIPGNVAWTGEGSRLGWRMKAAARRGRPAQLQLVDPAVLPAGGGTDEIEWAVWPGSPLLVREVDPFDLDWRALPQLFVAWSPVGGERVFFRPGDPLAAAGLEQRWREQLGRTPELRVPATRRQVLEALPPDEAVSRALALDAAVRDAGAASRRAGAALRRELALLARRPPLRTAAETLGPLALSGAPEPSGLVEVVDEGLAPRDRRGFRRVDGSQAAKVGLGREILDRPRSGDVGVGQALAFLRLDLDGGTTLVWNPAAELNERQLQKIWTDPLQLESYAQDVARRWQGRTGRRPGVRASLEAALVPWEPQAMVRPFHDVAAGGYGWLDHRPWIVPLRREALAARGDRTPTGGSGPP